jgi:undecaprenyl-diphosphatase
MNSFDSSIINFLNKFSHHSWLFDNIANFLSINNIVKGGIFCILLWWLWFKDNEHQRYTREHIIAIVIGCFIAVFLARALALLLPYRERPLHEATLNFILPYGIDPYTLIKWSSFPSDHAVLFFTLSTGLIFISKKIGIIAFIYTALFIAFPRIYLGIHYPTDIICGGLVGLAIGWISHQSIFINKVCKPILSYSEKKPSIFYALFFLITYQISDLFDASRHFIHFGVEVLKHII